MLWKHALLLVLLVSILINIKVGPLCYPVVPPLILGLFFNVRDLMERPLLDFFFTLMKPTYHRTQKQSLVILI